MAGSTGKAPYLASYRNFNEEIYNEMSHMEINHPLFKEVVGLGNRLIITNLSMDGAYGMTVFEKAGFYSLIAVPITTYKVLGIMGAVDRKKNRFNNDFTQLFAVIANLVGVALSKKSTTQQSVLKEDYPTISREPDINTNKERNIRESNPLRKESPAIDYERSLDEKLEIFHKHVRLMGAFRKQHD